MNPWIFRIAGVLLVAAGAYGLAEGEVRYTKESRELKLGPVELALREQERIEIPAWAGYGAVGVGVLLLLAAGGRKR
ncbi:MAG: hypothetical protein ACK5VV_04850 [Lysobacteraceae bacterium]|nr:hypothetical protein [Xanthomonadaceae bacterium]MCZ8319472.1 hypothetical protein [Silanimonas sp.]